MVDPEGNTDSLVKPGEFETNLATHRIERRPTEVFTAVVFYGFQDESDDSSALSSGSLPSLNATSVLPKRGQGRGDDGDSTTTHVDQVLSRFKVCSLALGLLVGFFIQLSSLGANFLWTSLYGNNEGSGDGFLLAQHHKIVIFSLGWSFFTSTLGVLILCLLGQLVLLALKAVPHDNERYDYVENLQYKLKLRLECYFAVGSLVGVCLAWTCTDIALGFKAHTCQSIATLGAAMLWCKLMSRCFGYQELDDTAAAANLPTDIDFCDDVTVSSEISDNNNNNNGISKPLLFGAMEDNQDYRSYKTIRQLQTSFKYRSLAQGLIVGLFIQFSSLGANFMLNVLNDNNKNNDGHQGMDVTRQDIIIFSLAWSFGTSSMGGLIFFLMRNLVVMAWSVVKQPRQFQDYMIASMECYFSVGALVGVNMAWIVTDFVLGLQAHFMHSTITLAAALVWCKVASFWFGCEQELKTKGVIESDETIVVCIV
jgi:hypothetical protein